MQKEFRIKLIENTSAWFVSKLNLLLLYVNNTTSTFVPEVINENRYSKHKVCINCEINIFLV